MENTDRPATPPGVSEGLVRAIDRILATAGRDRVVSLVELRQALTSGDRAYLLWGAPFPRDVVSHIAEAVEAAAHESLDGPRARH